MQFLAHGALLVLAGLTQAGLNAQPLVIRAVVNDSSPDGRLCPGCYGTVYYTPRELVFTSDSVTVLVNGQRALVNPGGESDEPLQGGSIRIVIPSTISPGLANVVVTTTDFEPSEPFAVDVDGYAPGLNRFDQVFSCSSSGTAKPGDTISLIATGLGTGNIQPSLLVSGKPATILPSESNGNLTIGESRLTFRAPQEEGYHLVVVAVAEKRSNPLMLPVGGSILNRSGASWMPGPAAPESVVTGIACGHDMGPEQMVVTADPKNPPTMLGTATVKVKDALGVERLASILATSGPQANYVIPTGTANGLATVIATATDGSSVGADLEIRSVAPGLFGAGLLVRLRNGVQTVYQLEVPISAVGGDSIAGQPGSAGIDMGPATDQVYLVLFGTGVRNRSSLSNVTVDIGGDLAPIEYAGAQGEFAGVDQVNVRLPRSLTHRGDVDLRLTVDGVSANLAHLSFY